MSWVVGFDESWQRDIGYGVPSVCDHSECDKKINRGLSYVCGGEPYGGEDGCGLYFCSDHMNGIPQQCERCAEGGEPFKPTPDLPEWVQHKATDPSWQAWRDEQLTTARPAPAGNEEEE